MLGTLGLAQLGIGAWLSLKTRSCPSYFTLPFRHSKSNRFGVHMVPKILWTLGTTILGQGRDCPIRNAPVHVCYLIKFHRSRSNRSGVCRVPIFWDAAAQPHNNGNMVDHEKYTFHHLCYRAKLCHSRSNCSSVIVEICQKFWPFMPPPFKATQGHWNRHAPPMTSY